jgi:hypothetical protein
VSGSVRVRPAIQITSSPASTPTPPSSTIARPISSRVAGTSDSAVAPTSTTPTSGTVAPKIQVSVSRDATLGHWPTGGAPPARSSARAITGRPIRSHSR